ncbi:MAG: CoA pyrophosphatase [Burkholderiaceae bacterium]
MAERPPRILDPKQIPVVGVDDHLPALPADRLAEAALRERFAAPHAWTPEFEGDGGSFLGEQAPTAASVLIPLVLRDAGPHVLLTRRTSHLRDHAGQISFPGGRAEEHDQSAVHTALRETEEEIGLDRRHVQVLGALEPYTTVTAYRVTPIVALVQPGFTLALDAFEVDEAFEVPLQFLMTPAHHRRHETTWLGRRRQFLSMPWQGIDPSGRPREYFIWGATAAMLRNLYGYLR